MSENKNVLKIIIAIFTGLLCIAGCFAAGVFLAVKYMPSFNVEPYFKFVQRGEPDEMAIVFSDRIVPENYYALDFADDALVDMDFLKDYGIDPYLFWDDAEQILTVSTPLKIINMKPEEAFYTVNGETCRFPVANTALLAKNEKVFVPLSFITEFYNINCGISREMKLVIFDDISMESTTAVLKRAATVRYEPSIKSDIAEKLKKGETVYVFKGTEDFTRIRTQLGVIGYIKTSDIGETTKLPPKIPKREEAPLWKFPGGRLVLVWDQIGSANEGEWLLSQVSGINAVSPTWFKLVSAQGDIKDGGNEIYARNAKEAGYELWPLFDNSFDADLTHESLKSTSIRRRIIDNIVQLAGKYDADGINVDFESYRIEDGYYYTQFLREFCVYMRNNGIATSVDLTVPTMSNSPTDRSEIGRYADYVIVMAYDQHWASSQTKGPVAAYDWVYDGIKRTLEYVPPEKTVLGIPFYTRIWYQPKGSDTITSKDFSMTHVSELFELRNANMTYEENTGYYKGEYEFDIDGVNNTITAWLETADTLMGKIEIEKEFSLAGIAGWKKGLETPEIWERIANSR